MTSDPTPTPLTDAEREAVRHLALILHADGHDGRDVAMSLDRTDAALIAALRNAAPALLEELAHLRRWKAEALEVMSGVREIGQALGVGLGEWIPSRATVDKALDLRNRAEAAETEVAALRERVEAVRAIHSPRLVTVFAGPEAGTKAQVCSHCEMTEASWPCPTIAALTTGGDRG